MRIALIIVAVLVIAGIIVGSAMLTKVLRRLHSASQSERALQSELTALQKTKEWYTSNIAESKKNVEELRLKIDELNNQYRTDVQKLDEWYTQLADSKAEEYDRWVQEATRNKENQYQKNAEMLNTRVEELRQQVEQYEMRAQMTMQTLEASTAEAFQTYQCLTDAYKKAELDSLQKTQYCIALEDNDISDIHVFLTDIINRVHDKSVVGKLVWTNYVQKPLSTLLKSLEIEDTPGIYKLTNIKNNKCYIGKSTTLKTRIQNHFKGACGIESISDQLIHHEMLKEGLNNWMVEKIIECPKEELNEKEKYYIRYFDSQNYGYNIAAGG